MSPPGRPEGDSSIAQREGSPVSPRRHEAWSGGRAPSLFQEPWVRSREHRHWPTRVMWAAVGAGSARTGRWVLLAPQTNGGAAAFTPRAVPLQCLHLSFGALRPIQ